MFAIAISVIGTASCGSSPAATYCNAAAECDESFFGIPVDGVGSSDDSIAVCEEDINVTLSSLRQNSEEDCHALADAYEVWFLCIESENADCEAWYDNECEDEREDIQDIANDVGNRCSE